MKTAAQKHEALKAWIRGVTGFGVNNVFLKNSGGPKPVGEYATFESPRTDTENLPFVTADVASGGEIERSHVQFCTVRAGVEFFGENGEYWLDQLRLSAGEFRYRSILSAADLVFIRKSATVYVPEYGDTSPLDRWHADFFFSTQKDRVEKDYELQLLAANIEFQKPGDGTSTGEISVGEITE